MDDHDIQVYAQSDELDVRGSDSGESGAIDSEGASEDCNFSNRLTRPADNITDGFDDNDAEAALARSMNPPVWNAPDEDTVMSSPSTLSNAIPTPPTHRHRLRKIHRRDLATLGLTFLDLEAAVDDQNAGNEQGEGGSETDNSIKGAINSKNLTHDST